MSLCPKRFWVFMAENEGYLFTLARGDLNQRSEKCSVPSSVPVVMKLYVPGLSAVLTDRLLLGL